MASARNQDPDDSFGSSNSNHSNDSIGGGFGDEGGAVHPFARAVEDDGDGFDDSFDSVDGDGDGDSLGVQEETVFGIPPAQRKHGRGPGELRLLGEDLLQDTIGIGSQLAKAGRIEESPTPYGRV
jgi:DASH complex subunit ASK1